MWRVKGRSEKEGAPEGNILAEVSNDGTIHGSTVGILEWTRVGNNEGIVDGPREGIIEGKFYGKVEGITKTKVVFNFYSAVVGSVDGIPEGASLGKWKNAMNVLMMEQLMVGLFLF